MDEYVKGSDAPIEHHIKEFVVTRDDLQLLLKELESVQDPEHEVYEGWIDDETREKWLVHICSVHQLLSTHMPVAEKQYNQDAKRKKDETRKSA